MWMPWILKLKGKKTKKWNICCITQCIQQCCTSADVPLLNEGDMDVNVCLVYGARFTWRSLQKWQNLISWEKMTSFWLLLYHTNATTNIWIYTISLFSWGNRIQSYCMLCMATMSGCLLSVWRLQQLAVWGNTWKWIENTIKTKTQKRSGYIDVKAVGVSLFKISLVLTIQ